MFSRLKQWFRRGDRKTGEREVHKRERDAAELRAEAEHYAHGHHGQIGGGGGFGGGS